jgi:hypothetical protein
MRTTLIHTDCVIWPRQKGLQCSLREVRLQAAGPAHLLAHGIEKRIPSGHLPERLRPARRGGTWLACGANGFEYPAKHLIYGAWSE